jgi:hypothetical protein
MASRVSWSAVYGPKPSAHIAGLALLPVILLPIACVAKCHGVSWEASARKRPETPSPSTAESTVTSKALTPNIKTSVTAT